MREMRLVGLSQDHTHLVLTGPETGTVALPVDERLRAAVLGDQARLGQLDVPPESALSPREIQARLRAGASADEIAADAGVPVDRVRRFEGPVRDERLHVVEAARAAVPRRDGLSTVPMGEAVDGHLTAAGVEPDSVSWDSWRREDGSWLVQLSLPAEGRTRTAHWVWDPLRRQVTVGDAEAAELIGSDSADDDLLGLAVAVTTAHPSSHARDLRPAALTLVRERAADIEALELAEADVAPVTDVEPEPVPAPEPAPVATQSERRTGRTDRQAEADGVAPGRRATVPSWDEILFGSRPPEN